MSRRGNVLLRISERILAFAAVVCFAGAFLETVSRVIHLGRYPLLPYYFDASVARLPANRDMKVSFYGGLAHRFVTDSGGARIADPSMAKTNSPNGVFAIGDSQALGYTVDFKQAFPSLVAASLTGDSSNARILAAPAVTPEDFPSMLRDYGHARAGVIHQKLFIAVINLGNDLDEIYEEGLNPSPVRTSDRERFLISNSFTYMDWVLLRSHRLINSNEPMGIDPILYMLDPDERIVLAREVADNLDSFLKTVDVAGQNKLIVIIPSDFQVDRREFLKYRRYYRSTASFESWDKRVPAFEEMMNSIESYMADRLTGRGYEVVRFSQLDGIHDSEVFDESSHHLNATGHGLLAAGILRALDKKHG